MTLPAGLYGIADASFGDPVAIGNALIRAECPIIQLRAKGWPTTQIERAAAQLLGPARQAGIKLIINDHVDVALSVGADGVHLGQEDGCTEAARARLGPTALIGMSTHNMKQVLAATHADYIGFGPIFATSTKAKAGEGVGVDSLAKVVQMSPVPVVAIGGITRFNLHHVRETGAHSWAVIRDLIGLEPIGEAIQHLAF